MNLSQKLDTISLRNIIKKENSLLDAIQRHLLIYVSRDKCITNRRHSRKKRFENSDIQSSVTNTESVNKRLEGTQYENDDKLVNVMELMELWN